MPADMISVLITISPNSSSANQEAEHVAASKARRQLFGYETAIEESGKITGLQGKDLHGTNKPELKVGMVVLLEVDSTGYVPGGFQNGEKGVIANFRKPWENGVSDHIVQVTNETNTGWVKPSNIRERYYSR